MGKGSLSPVRDSMEDCSDHATNGDVKHSVASSGGVKTNAPSGWASSDDEEHDPMDQDDVGLEAETDDGSGMSFKEHRRTHYDEYLKVKELMRNGSQLDDKTEGNDTNGKMEVNSISSKSQPKK